MATFRLGKRYEEFKKALRRSPEEMGKAMSEGLQFGLLDAAEEAKTQYDGYLKAPTGSLRRSIHNYPDEANPFVGYVGHGDISDVQKYGWQLFDHTATPKKGKYMVIPAGHNVTSAGAARYSSPLELKDQGGFFIRKGGRLLFGIRENDQFKLMFVLVKEVKGSGLIPEVMETEKWNVIRTAKSTVMKAMKRIGVVD